MKVLIIEDEIPAQRMLSSMLNELAEDIEIVGVIGNVEAAIKWFKTNKHPDIVLMDIQLSDGISFDILESVKVDSMLIFTTAFDDYAIQAFKVNSIDYILKPYELDDLRRAFDKYKTYNKTFLQEKNAAVNFSEITQSINNSKTDYRKRFLIHSGESFYKLPVNDIAYFYSSNKITFAVTFSSREVPIDISLEKLQEQLDPISYFKINRQFILNIESILKIHSFFDGKLVVDTKPQHKEKIIVGKDKAAEFKRWIDN